MHRDKMSTIWIIIVNYRTSGLVIDCLRSLAQELAELPKARVIVVDNNSGDDSVEKLAAAIERECWSSWASMMPLSQNGGFAFGNNACMRIAMQTAGQLDYLMLLNPDTVVLPGAVKSLLSFMDAQPKVGIAGSMLKDADGQVDSSAHIFPSPLSELLGAARLSLLDRLLPHRVVTPPIRQSAYECDWISGASMIIRRQVVEDIGLMDDGYFLYFEEVDYCLRAHKAGWQCWYVPDSQVIHLEGSSTGIRAAAKRRAAYWYDSRRRFFLKHYGISGLVTADALWFLGRLSYLLRKNLRPKAVNNKNNDPKWFMFDLLWGDLRTLMSGHAWKISQTRNLKQS